MIYFDGTRAFGTVSYYLWKLFAEHRPDEMVAVTTEFPDAKPATIAGQVGVGTWDATAEFKDIRVERDGKVILRGEDGDISASEREGGDWSMKSGVFRQSRRGFGMQYFGDPQWSDYTLSLKARKQSGGEGFLIVFGRQGQERYWWNLGGWGNHQHAIEMNQSPVGQSVRGRIESDRWYDIKIELAGNRIRCYLDGKLLHDVESTPPQKFFVNAGRDKSDDTLIVKAINMGTEPQAATIKLSGAADAKSEAECTVLTSASLTDNNSLASPMAVAPRQEKLAISGLEFTHEFPPRSLSILRIQPKSD